MLKPGYLITFTSDLRWLTAFFLLTLSIGFFLGLNFVDHTSRLEVQGVIENYNGNESDFEAEEMKFKKSAHEILNILHTHFLSLSLIFFILGFLTYGVPMNRRFRKFLMLEPMLSVIFTFGGIYFLWSGWEWCVYIVMISGFLMTLSFTLAVGMILKTLVGKTRLKH